MSGGEVDGGAEVVVHREEVLLGAQPRLVHGLLGHPTLQLLRSPTHSHRLLALFLAALLTRVVLQSLTVYVLRRLLARAVVPGVLGVLGLGGRRSQEGRRGVVVQHVAAGAEAEG